MEGIFMTNPVSVFIMDVSNSSKEGIGSELSNYLQDLEERIGVWTKDITRTKVIHRSGDEIVVVSSGYATAYTLAFYISRIWSFKEHQPYFGISYGDIQNDVSTLNIETWVHPLMKQARNASDILKRQGQKRDQFNFALADVLNEKISEEHYFFRSQFETLLNVVLKLQQDQMNEQTDIQSLACSLFLILNQQNKVAHYLDRSASTVSSHIKKGKCESIISSFNDVLKVLNSLQAISVPNQQVTNDKLQRNIKRIVSKQLGDYFSID